MIINPYRFATGTGYLLDDYTGASAGYSLRALSSSYETTNAVVQVIRTGDETLDTFTASDVTDGTLATWVANGGGTENGYIRTLYDQSGNGNDAIQVAVVAQEKPQIVSGGTLLSDGILFNGTDAFLDCGFAAGSASAQSIFAVAQTSDLTANRILVDGRDANDDGAALFFLGSTTADFMRWSVDSAADPTGNDLFTGSLSANTEYLFSGYYGTPNSTIFLDGTQADTDTSAPASISTTETYKIGRAAFTNSAFWQGSIQEVIIYPDDQSANQAGIDGNIKTHYGI